MFILYFKLIYIIQYLFLNLYLTIIELLFYSLYSLRCQQTVFKKFMYVFNKYIIQFKIMDI
jgi:hypothetical protein